MARISILALVAIFAVSTAQIAKAETPMTEQEIASAFKKQKTRGLTLVPTTDAAVAAASEAPAGTTVTAETIANSEPAAQPVGAGGSSDVGLATVAADAATIAGSAPAGPAGTASEADLAYAQLPKEEQVNVSIRFDLDSASLRADQKPALAALCSGLQSASVSALRIVGHTDISGSADYNQRLSLLRAEEVKRYLASADCGIKEDRMEAVGVGSRYLLDGEKPKDAVNRRVEFQALS